MTSFDCIFRLRKILKTKKIGHTGTLDPEVDGVLPICVGAATKAAEFLTESGKAYRGEITLGFSTETEDAHGAIVDTRPVDALLTTAQIDEAMASFVGMITQIPPMYSAVKVKGKRLYEYARQGETVERPERQASIESFVRISEPVYDEKEKTQSWQFEVVCGKGTYIRTLAVDLGARLGYPAHMSRLTRTESGPFKTDDCVTLAEVEAHVQAGTLNEILLPIEPIFSHLPHMDLGEELWERVKNGALLSTEDLPHPPPSNGQEPVAFFYQDRIVALYEPHPNKLNIWKPRKMFLP